MHFEIQVDRLFGIWYTSHSVKFHISRFRFQTERKSIHTMLKATTYEQLQQLGPGRSLRLQKVKNRESIKIVRWVCFDKFAFLVNDKPALVSSHVIYGTIVS